MTTELILIGILFILVIFLSVMLMRQGIHFNQKLENDAKEKGLRVNDVDKKVDLLAEKIGLKYSPEITVTCYNSVLLHLYNKRQTIPAHFEKTQDPLAELNVIDKSFSLHSQQIEGIEIRVNAIEENLGINQPIIAIDKNFVDTYNKINKEDVKKLVKSQPKSKSKLGSKNIKKEK